MRVRRFDRVAIRLDRAERLDNGWLRADAAIGRVGVFPYEGQGGEVKHELRPPEEVFDADSMRSFSLLPVTNNHPPEQLNALNVRMYQIGNSGDNIRRDESAVLLLSTVMLTDAQAVGDAEAGKVELSPGYTVELDETPGVWNGIPYDAIQRKIRGNHIALVDQGRQGREVSIRLDSGDAVAAHGETMKDPKKNDDKKAEPKDDARTKTLKIGDNEHEVPSAVATAFAKQADKIAKLEAKLEDLADKAKGRKDEGDPELDTSDEKLRARLDALEADNKALRDGQAARIDARVALVTTARDVCGHDYRADGKTDHAIMREVVAKVRPDADLEGKSDGYIEGAYEHAIEVHGDRKDHGQKLLEAAAQVTAGDDEVDEVEAARRKDAAERENAWNKSEKE